MNRPTSLLISLIALAGIAAETKTVLKADEPAIIQRDAVECLPRGGLPNVQSRLKSGQEVRVAYFGGSITEAAGWRVKSMKWLKRQYPDARLLEINAAIGGTGSDLGVFRLQHDVLDYEPNLLFVEFAVNDGGADPTQIIRCFEGIVRQTWRANPTTDICFVYTTSQPFYTDLKAGKASRSATAMESIADHYGIPSIQLGLEVVQLDSAGKLTFKGTKPTEPRKPEDPIVFSEDGVHPLDDGHELYLQAIIRSWPKLVSSSAPAAHTLPDPLRADNWEQAQLVPIAKTMLKGGWVLQDPVKDFPAKIFSSRVPSLWKTSEVGSSMEFEFEGRYAAIYDLLAPDAGIVELQIDDQPPRKSTRFDGYCVYPRLATLVILNEPSIGKHRVKITLLAESPDKPKILFPHNRADLEKNPQKYADNAWYVGGVMILGQMTAR